MSVQPPVARQIKRDPRVWVSALTLTVTWGVALLNMNGISVSRRSVSADASDWKVMLAMATVSSAILVPVVALRVMFWKRAVPTMGQVVSVKRLQNGMRLNYTYSVSGTDFTGKVSPGFNSALAKTAVGGQVTVYFDPKKPAKSVAPL
jgi:hypothetical protein